jgi:DsbC/DsbD-like thiol-disulfide interchange protein
MFLRFRTAVIGPLGGAFGLLAVSSLPATPSDSSPWDDDIRSAVRLIAARPGKDAQRHILRVGIEIKLHPGWKTYWRYPGDSGVPPAFDFSASSNVKDVKVLFPAPLSFDDGAGGRSIGYKDSVILPVHIVATDAAHPVTLRLKLDYGACEKLCVPAKATLDLALDGGDSAHDAAVTAAEARVPKVVAIGQSGAIIFQSVRREAAEGKPRIVVDVLAKSMVSLFAEGPSADWALPLPQRVNRSGLPLHIFTFALNGLPPGAKADGAALRLTAVSAEGAAETVFRLD